MRVAIRGFGRLCPLMASARHCLLATCLVALGFLKSTEPCRRFKATTHGREKKARIQGAAWVTTLRTRACARGPLLEELWA